MCVGLLVGPTSVQADDISDFFESCAGHEDAEMAECIITSIVIGSAVLVVAASRIHRLYIKHKYKDLKTLAEKLADFKDNDYNDIAKFIVKIIPKSVKSLAKAKGGIFELKKLALRAKDAVKSLKGGTYRVGANEVENLRETLTSIQDEYEQHSLFENIDNLNDLKELADEVVEKSKTMDLGLTRAEVRVLESASRSVEVLVSKSTNFTDSLGSLINRLDDVEEGQSFTLSREEVDKLYDSSKEFEDFAKHVEQRARLLESLLTKVKNDPSSVVEHTGGVTVSVGSGDDPTSGNNSGNRNNNEPETEPTTSPPEREAPERGEPVFIN